MDKIQKSERFKFIVQKVIDETKAGTLKISDEPRIEINETSFPKRRGSLLDTFKRATSFIKKGNKERRMRRVATEKQLPNLFSGLKVSFFCDLLLENFTIDIEP